MSATKTLKRTRNGNMPSDAGTSKIVDYWIERLLTPMAQLERLGRDRDWLERCSMSFRDDALRHYGHWTLAQGVRDKRGRTKLVVINGDRYTGSGGYGPSTMSRTTQAEDAARQAGLDVLNVPLSALHAAGIRRLVSIRVLEAKRETWEVQTRSYNEANLKSLWRLTRHDDGSMSVLDERYGYHGHDHRLPVERIEHERWTEYLVPTFRHWLGEAVFTAEVEERGGRLRRAKFLSAFDHNESRPCYFLCELPPTGAMTVEEAFEALAPAEVKRAREAGLDVLRQGDIFAIPTSLTTREVKRRAIDQTITRYERTGVEHFHPSIYEAGVGYREDVTRTVERDRWEHVPYAVKTVRMEPLLGTNHVATEQATTSDGDTYARGVLRHRPAFREPDHAQIKLGDGRTWYRIIKNTVPLAKDVRSNTVLFAAQQSGQSRAWTLGGQVD